MREDIEEFKQRNGNVNYTVKELVQGLHIRMDRIEDRFEDRVKTYVTKNSFRTVVGLLIVLLGGLASFVFTNLQIFG